MYLTITSTAEPATDLGYLLHKHPGRAQSVDLSFGQAHVFYPEATEQKCTAALLLEVDPVAQARGRRSSGAPASLAHYVNDRPYAASSMLALAVGKVFRTAVAGRCELRPELVGQALPLVIRLPAVPAGRIAGDGPDLVRRFFAPLGWHVGVLTQPLDPQIPEWGDSRYVEVTLTGSMPLAQALSHLYVLLPVLDEAKHYWVNSDEVDKLIRAGGSWLAGHPERDLITRRYLAHQGDLVLSAVGRLAEVDQSLPGTFDNATPDNVPDDSGGRPALGAERVSTVLAELRAAGAGRVVDLGCGEGVLLRGLLKDPAFGEIVGVDVSPRALARAEKLLGLDRMPDQQRQRLTLRQSSVTYRDEQLTGYDAIVLMEVIEHLDPARLPSLESAVFGVARPRVVIVTTPNADYNVRYPRLAGAHRHADHRFEWTRAEFGRWADGVAGGHGYSARTGGIGPADPDLGAPTQLAVFSRDDAAQQVSSASRGAGR